MAAPMHKLTAQLACLQHKRALSSAERPESKHLGSMRDSYPEPAARRDTHELAASCTHSDHE